MRIGNRSWIFCAAIVAAIPTNASAGVVNNVLTQWRGHADKCEDPRQLDMEAMVNVAMFEAINAVTPKYTPYTRKLEAPDGSSPEAAAARAAHGNWSLAGGAFRAERLERAADLLEEHERQAIDVLIEALVVAERSEDAATIEAATQALAKGTEAFAAMRMNRGIAQALSGKNVESL